MYGWCLPCVGKPRGARCARCAARAEQLATTMRAYNRRRAAERAAVPRPARPPRRPAVDWDALLHSGRTATEVARLIGYSLPGVLKQARKRGIVLPRGLPGVRRSERLR